MADKIKIDADILEETIRCYARSIDKMTTARNDINNGVNSLDLNWEGAAKDAYMNMKNANWEKGLNEHIDRIKFLKERLDEVKDCYEEIQDKSKSI